MEGATYVAVTKASLWQALKNIATLGMAEDTWALNEGVTSESTFLQQTYDIDQERRSMFFSALDRLHRGTLVCGLHLWRFDLETGAVLDPPLAECMETYPVRVEEEMILVGVRG